MKEKDLASSIISRQFWIIIILIVALVGSNVGWLIYESQYEIVGETITTEMDTEGQGTNNYIGNDGEINNG